jgi:hypothetical protein
LGFIDLRLNYNQEPVPGFEEKDALWLDAWLKGRGILMNKGLKPLASTSSK